MNNKNNNLKIKKKVVYKESMPIFINVVNQQKKMKCLNKLLVIKN